jgi:hypothetical protein
VTIFEDAQKEFDNWVLRFDVIKTFPEDLFDKSPYKDEFVWTEFEDLDQDFSFVMPGYTEWDDESRMPVIGYWIARKSWIQASDENFDVKVGMRVPCKECSGTGTSPNDEECILCQGFRGSFIEFDNENIEPKDWNA